MRYFNGDAELLLLETVQNCCSVCKPSCYSETLQQLVSCDLHRPPE